ncbi:hypothetical protein FQN55_002666 [Onygenales sp. PD_40]|nr:hypothetical protein FQN55_002666 [Onygenales sp. PD_40]KAK2789028.1 hypothetical protein FQN52_006395 [Onygenales sp. PD_12]
MATPIRRSARLRSITPTTSQKTTPRPSTKLVSVAERDETRELGSPQHGNNALATPLNRSSVRSSTIQSHSKPHMKTPDTSGLLKPGLEEMHPSKVQQSTSKQPDSGLCLGFKPIQPDPNHPSNTSTRTPTKSRLAQTDQLDSPSFALQFSCEDSQLSEEAKKLMENIREDAARIKAQMIIESSAQKRKEAAIEQEFGDRKFAKAKGKAGRFSNAHMAEFKKMDSIVGHASSFRANPARFQSSPAKTPVKSLKRTSSKACLDDTEKPRTPAKPWAAPATPAKMSTNASIKRPKISTVETPSTHQPLSKDGRCGSKIDPKPAQYSARATVTPKKLTVARASSVKQDNTSKIPNFPRSPSTKSIVAPRTPQTEFNPKLKSRLPSLTNLKSILRKRQPLFSTDPVKIAAGTHVAPPSKIFDVPEQSTTKKRVDFSASTKLRHAFSDVSPTPKISPDGAIDESVDEETQPGTISYPTLPQMTPEKDNKATKLAFGAKASPTIRTVTSSEVLYPRPAFPSHAAIPHGIVNKKRRRDDADDEDVENHGPENPTEDERSQKRFKPNPAIAVSVRTPSPIKTRPGQRTGATPGQRATLAQGTPSRSTQKSRGVLSMSRLNMLSRPKGRR